MTNADWHHYLDVLKNNDIFACVQDKSVLELASNGGWHSRLIYEKNPKKLVCIEPDKFFMEPLYDTFASDHEDIECFWGTYNQYLEEEKTKFDVVICCGILYHLHSPLDCIEKIINIHQPKTLIIENFDVDYEHLNEEELDLCGNAFKDNSNDVDSFIKLYNNVNEVAKPDTKKKAAKKKTVKKKSK